VPELPEVETVRRDLAALLPGRTVTRVEVPDPRAVQGFGPDGRARRRETPAAFAAALFGRTAREVLRRGKYLGVRWDDGSALLVHLRMTGQLIFGPPRPNARALIFFSDGSCLNFCDTRRFGELWRAANWSADPSVRALGPEPLGDGWDVAAWGRSLRRCGARVQSALLDQRRLAGLGNIYVTEALFLSGVRPTRRARTLRSADIPVLAANIQKVLNQGIAHRGVSFRDYRDARGERGRAREKLEVYGKAGRPCPRCETPLRGVKVNGRGTVYCPQCQK